jgi:hypothetical protein
MEMTASENVERVSPLSRKNLLRMLVGALFGAGFGYAAVKTAVLLHVAVTKLAWADVLGLWLGVTYFGIGAIMLAVSFNRRELAKNLEGGAAKVPASEEEVRSARLQASTLVLAAAMLLLPVLTSGSLAKTAVGAAGVFWAILVLFGLQTAANAMVWRTCDEFQRGVILTAGALTFAVGQGALFLWAAAEHLGLAQVLPAWDLAMVMMTLYLGVGTYLQVRTMRWK